MHRLIAWLTGTSPAAELAMYLVSLRLVVPSLEWVNEDSYRYEP